MLFLSIFFACTSKTEEVEEGVPFNEGPEISVTFAQGRIVEGDPFSLSISLADEDGLSSVSVYYRKEGTLYWEEVSALEQSTTDTARTLTTDLPEILSPGIEFYVKATDDASTPAYSLYPERGPEEPLHVSILPRSNPLPFHEDFENGTDLLTQDWWTPTDGRSSFAFFLSSGSSQSGDNSAYHSPGSPGIDPLSDWLISPPLDFSGQDGVMVGWWESVRGPTEESSHGLYISTGERLPESGDYVEVTTLELPTDSEWRRYRYVDVSQWAGEPLVYLGWRWQGSLADEWFIDDVSVRTIAPDIEIGVEALVDPAVPGTPYPLSVTIENKTNAPANNLFLEIAFPDGGASMGSGAQALGPLDAMGAMEMDIEILLDDDLAPNRYLPIELSVTDGVETWQREDSLLIGYPSTAVLTLSSAIPSFVEAQLGVGDPENPSWTGAMFLGVVEGEMQQIEFDITDLYAYLPPAAGDNRWFVDISSDQQVELYDFSIRYGNEVYSTPISSGFEILFPGFESSYFIPPPPAPSLYSVSPSAASPGEDVAIQLSFLNQGNASEGPVVADIYSLSAGAIVSNAEGIVLDSDTWNYYEYKTLYGPSIRIDASHTSSLPLQFEAVLRDDVESWTLPFSIEIPYPVMQIIGVTVEDDDGLLSPDETSELEITISNVGGLNAFGPVSAELSVGSNSTVSASVVNDSPSFGFVNAGSVKSDDDFSITVDGGSLGDSVELVLSMTDSEATYTDQVELVLGEPPWFSLSPIPDGVGDILDPSSLDIYAVDYRVVGDRFELRVESVEPINAGIAFLEIWGSSVGAEYSFYRWVLQSGVGTMQGYRGGEGFTQLGTLDVEFEGTNLVVLSWNISDMNLSIDSIDLGLAAGWCGPPEYYCDQYPDGWGYPYESMNTGLWFEASF
ncbi:MAG: choice-of-anchor J domain-containing protein [Myxococcota bacterium]|nr:choice-of-anchor J domain-containing protein [Myxococcota bacterium]